MIFSLSIEPDMMTRFLFFFFGYISISSATVMAEREILLSELKQAACKNLEPPMIVAIASPACASCQKNQAVLKALSQDYRIIVIHLEKPPENMSTLDHQMTHVFDPTGVLIKKMQIRYLPLTYILGLNDDQTEKIVGSLDFDRMHALMENIALSCHLEEG